MKMLVLGVIFIAVPFWLLTHFVLPALNGLGQIYGNLDTISQQSALGTNQVR